MEWVAGSGNHRGDPTPGDATTPARTTWGLRRSDEPFLASKTTIDASASGTADSNRTGGHAWTPSRTCDPRTRPSLVEQENPPQGGVRGDLQDGICSDSGVRNEGRTDGGEGRSGRCRREATVWKIIETEPRDASGGWARRSAAAAPPAGDHRAKGLDRAPPICAALGNPRSRPPFLEAVE